MEPSLEIETNKEKKREKNETYGMEESGGKFPPLLINLVNQNKKGREKRGKKKRERRGKGKRGRKGKK